jgi:hypothetical protein
MMQRLLIVLITNFSLLDGGFRRVGETHHIKNGKNHAAAD